MRCSRLRTLLTGRDNAWHRSRTALDILSDPCPSPSPIGSQELRTPSDPVSDPLRSASPSGCQDFGLHPKNFGPLRTNFRTFCEAHPYRGCKILDLRTPITHLFLQNFKKHKWRGGRGGGPVGIGLGWIARGDYITLYWAPVFLKGKKKNKKLSVMT